MIRRIALALVALALLRADMFQDASNAKRPEAAANLGLAVSVKDYGAIGDGVSHPLSERYATLAEAQAWCPRATSLTTDELDWCAADAAIARIPAPVGTADRKGGIKLRFPGSVNGYYRLSKPLVVNDVSIWFDGDGQLDSRLIWNAGSNGIEYGLAATGSGGSLRISNMTLAPAPGAMATMTATAIKAIFKIAIPTLTMSNVNLGGGTGDIATFGSWRIGADLTGLSSSAVEDVKVTGATAGSSPDRTWDPLSIGFKINSTPGEGGTFHHYWSRVFTINYHVGFEYNMSAEPEEGGTGSIQGVYFNSVDATNGGDYLRINNNSGRALPQWMITNGHWAGIGWFVDTSRSAYRVGKLVAQGNFIQPNHSNDYLWPAAAGPVPPVGGGFNMVADESTVIMGNQISVIGFGLPRSSTDVRGLWATGLVGPPAVPSNGGVFSNNICQLPTAYHQPTALYPTPPGAYVTMTCAYFDTLSLGWTLGRNSARPVNDNVVQTVNLGASNTASSQLVKSNGSAVTNTGVSTTDFITLANIRLPPLGPTDGVRVNVLWSVAGTATNTKEFRAKFSPSGCTVGAACVDGVYNIQSLVSDAAGETTMSVTSQMWNKGATNAQVAFNATNLLGIGPNTGAPASFAVETKDSAYVSLTCRTTTSTADACTLNGYTVEILPGM